MLYVALFVNNAITGGLVGTLVILICLIKAINH